MQINKKVMANDVQNVQMRLLSLKEVSFMMSPGKMPDDANPESVKLGFSNQTHPDVKKDVINLVFGVKYELAGDTILESIYSFMFEIKGLDRFVIINGANMTIAHIMPHLLSVACGTMRGILVVKTAGTSFSKFPLPMIDPNQLSACLSSAQSTGNS